MFPPELGDPHDSGHGNVFGVERLCRGDGAVDPSVSEASPEEKAGEIVRTIQKCRNIGTSITVFFVEQTQGIRRLWCAGVENKDRFLRRLPPWVWLVAIILFWLWSLYVCLIT